MSNRILASLLTVAMILAVPLALAGQAKETTLTGCLNKDGNSYVLAEEKGGKKHTVTGLAELEAHSKNHKVEVTGSMTKEGGKDVFKASKLRHVAAECKVTS
jgi:hypothetical protein